MKIIQTIQGTSYFDESFYMFQSHYLKLKYTFNIDFVGLFCCEKLLFIYFFHLVLKMGEFSSVVHFLDVLEDEPFKEILIAALGPAACRG